MTAKKVDDAGETHSGDVVEDGKAEAPKDNQRTKDGVNPPGTSEVAKAIGEKAKARIAESRDGMKNAVVDSLGPGEMVRPKREQTNGAQDL